MICKNRCLVVLTFVIFFLGAAAFAQQLPELPRAALEHAIAIQERYTDDLMADPEVVGTGVGVGANGQAVIKVFVKRGQLAGLRGSLDGIPVVTQVTGEIVALKGPPENVGGGGGGGGGGVDPTARFARPVPIGVSTGHPDITAGTIGARVTRGTNVYALSNNHVYADENTASPGDAVIQPGTFDGGSSPADDIGTLDDFQPIVWCPPTIIWPFYSCTGIENKFDAAIVLSSTSLLGNATPSDGYGTPQSTTVPPRVRMRVKKYGRATSQTKGRVDAIHAIVDVRYDSGVARFVDQIIIVPGSFSAGGDSGSLIVVEKGSDADKPVGLLFAGSTTITVASPIDPILARFSVTVDGP
ncbi:MAG: hypothetical protein O7B35_18030 [Deltaproteobacteria bacterium]|nr:hypothetical protein [Deltaproteobacteria bacterium]